MAPRAPSPVDRRWTAVFANQILALGAGGGTHAWLCSAPTPRSVTMPKVIVRLSTSPRSTLELVWHYRRKALR